MTHIALTDEQVANWRTVLRGVIGPYAEFLTQTEIEDMAGMMQEDINAYSEELEKELEKRGEV